MTPNPTEAIDFRKVEALRKHMLLTIKDMAALLGVSRITYHGWVRGKPIRKARDEAVRAMLRKLLAVVTKHGWPTPEEIKLGNKNRRERLIDLLKSLD